MSDHMTRSRSSLAIWVLIISSAMALSGCKKSGNCGCAIGEPTVVFGDQLGRPAIVASSPNPCELDVDFGTLPVREEASVAVKILNVGAGVVDFEFDGSTQHPPFEVNLASGGSIEPGRAYVVPITFRPLDAGQVSSSVVIQTDGNNTECADGSTIRVELVGTGS